MNGPQRLGPYEILGEVARGGMGVVYRARDPRSGDQVALKLLLAGQATEAQRRRFQREAQALARLEAPGIVRLREVGELQGRPYLVLDWVEGRSLQDRLDTEGALPAAEAASIVAQLARALEQAHAQGIVHRDLKPANVLVGDQGQPILTDFGLGKDLDSTSGSLSKTGMFLGTPGYWPPEQAAGDLARIGPAADVYGLGATLYALVTRVPPIAGRTLAEIAQATLQAAPRPPSALSEGDRAFDAICLRCLEKEPARRYPSAASLAEALEAYAARGPQAPRGRPAVAVAAAILVLGLLGAAALILRDDAAPPPPVVASEPVAAVSSAPAPDPLAPIRRLQAEGRWETSLERLDAHLEEQPTDAEALYLRGEARWELEDAVRSLLDWGKASDQEGEFALAGALRLGDVLVQAQAGPGALKHAKRALELSPGDPRALRIRAEAYYLTGDYEAALADYGWLLERAPDDVDLLWKRGLVLVTVRDFEAARADLDRALELEPDHRGARHQRISLLMLNDDLDGAARDAERVLAQNPRDGLAWSSLATIRLNQGDEEGAIEAADEAIELSPENAQGWLARGIAHQNLGQLAEALADLDQAVKANPREPWAIWTRADLKRAMGDEAGWRSDLRRTRRLFPVDSPQRREIDAALADD